MLSAQADLQSTHRHTNEHEISSASTYDACKSTELTFGQTLLLSVNRVLTSRHRQESRGMHCTKHSFAARSQSGDVQ